MTHLGVNQRPVSILEKRVDRGVLAFQKRFQRRHLLLDDRLLNRRLTAISRLGHTSRHVPWTQFSHRGPLLLQTQERIVRCARPGGDVDGCVAALKRLAAFFDGLNGRVVHGDVTSKNLIFDGSEYMVVDWEPSLLQIRDGCKTLMYTEPYISHADRSAERLSVETDKLGFFYTAHRIVHGYRALSDIRRLIWLRRRGLGRRARYSATRHPPGRHTHGRCCGGLS